MSKRKVIDGALTAEQQQGLELAMSGQNVCILGAAGTGKSFLIEHMTSEFSRKRISFALTAPTGIAALNINGRTLHSWSSCPPDKKFNVMRALTIIRKNPISAQRWKTTRVLIIDEISMIDPRFFELLENVARLVRRREQPFGGIQLIMLGDFFQLPPVQPDLHEPTYLFENQIWRSCIHRTIHLKTIKRQKNKEFIDILTEVRTGKVSEKCIQILQSTSKNNLASIQAGISPTRLYCTRKKVDTINKREARWAFEKALVKASRGEIYMDGYPYFAEEFHSIDVNHDGNMRSTEEMDKLFRERKTLVLCSGTQVMLTRNISVECGYVNGTRGVVIGKSKSVEPSVVIKLMDGRHLTIGINEQQYENDTGRVIASRSQLSLEYAWCMTVHKSQSMTIDLLEIDLSGVFTYAMAYVALSRGIALERICVHNFTKASVLTSDKVLKLYNK